ncbi:MAG: hypothetical protein LLF28_04025 [Nitrospiraceae bacterium]|nr:hypothetical protein [Nitrospiraceae bacterium]
MRVRILIIIIIFVFIEIFFGESVTALEKKVFIEMDSIPSIVIPGDKPITLTKEFLTKLLPELKNPRLMSLEDFADPEDKEAFLESGCTFVLRGDFNNDGIADLAFVGKYDNLSNPKYSSFFVIVSIKQKKVVREYFTPLMTSQVALLNVLKYKRKIDAIELIYHFESEECGYLFWSNKKYVYQSCLD